jgi:hypothetical protein
LVRNNATAFSAFDERHCLASSLPKDSIQAAGEWWAESYHSTQPRLAPQEHAERRRASPRACVPFSPWTSPDARAWDAVLAHFAMPRPRDSPCSNSTSASAWRQKPEIGLALCTPRVSCRPDGQAPRAFCTSRPRLGCWHQTTNRRRPQLLSLTQRHKPTSEV